MFSPIYRPPNVFFVPAYGGTITLYFIVAEWSPRNMEFWNVGIVEDRADKEKI
jgi:hypothetical protein